MNIYRRFCFRTKRGATGYMLSAIFLLSGCSLSEKVSRQLGRDFRDSEILNQYQAGFALYDLKEGKMLYEKDADKYFIPASNTKLFTFYAGLKMLADSVPSLRYVLKGDSLIFWGTGDPSFLQTDLKGTNAFAFLKSANKKLFYAPGRYTGSFYGVGWQWDDYNDYYQAEINELPLMDNLVAFSAGPDGKLQSLPRMFETCLEKDNSRSGDFKLVRAFGANSFQYNAARIPADYRQAVPYKINLATTLNLLSDTLKKKVELIDMEMPAAARTIYNVKRDSVLKQMMLPSDNFIAEQLLLVYANQIGAELNTTKTIAYIQSKYLPGLPGKPQWVDGSGLSRMNLFTPREMVTLLEMIYKEVNDPEKLFSMLPAGGNRGTLKNAYPKTDKPFVFGKTGTLSNNYCQSGYILTKKGKILLFSFMNNNFVLPVAAVRKELARVVTYIHDNF